MGWYHSHPFDVEVHSHCFLSSTDISTQLSWQRAEDPHGNPWLAIVVSLIALKIVLFSAGFASKAVYHALFSSSETQCCTTVVDSKREIRRPLYRAGHNVLTRSLRCGLLVSVGNYLFIPWLLGVLSPRTSSIFSAPRLCCLIAV